MPSLENKVSIVTGSTSGIGRGIAAHFARLGSKVVVTGRDAQRGGQSVDQIRKAGGEAAFFQADLAIPEQCRAIIQFALDTFDAVDVLVNNAALMTRGNIEATPVETWDAIMNVNLRAPFICLQAAIVPMKARGGGSVINIGSVNAYIGEPKLAAYSASKGGLMTLTRNAASSLGKYRIRVNQINVGWTLTEGEDRVKREEGKGEDWLAGAIATRPFGRLLSPEDVARAAAYFASADSECISGSVLDLEQYPIGAPPNW